jgi:diguanylate cyclase (GGDEF)-like protein
MGKRAMARQTRLRTDDVKADAQVDAPVSRPHDRAAPDAPMTPAGAMPAPSEPMRLAAEVSRLEAELAAMRVRVAELETHAERDPLTAIMNRRGFERELARASSYLQRYGGSAALVYLDLDGFKPVNDRHGHAAGDAVLKAVAAALLIAVRASDMVARIGGDEFAVLLWNLSPAAATTKALALERAITAATVTWDGGSLSVGASAGVAALGPDQDLGGLVARADAAMYARKRERKSLGMAAGTGSRIVTR